MTLPAYNCVMCTDGTEETTLHLFIECNFAKQCWSSIGIQLQQSSVPFFMDIIILMSWSIWIERNGETFRNITATIAQCRATLRKELALVVHRAKSSVSTHLLSWIETHL
ncbi:hypothetical protein PVAP13_1KG069342 [Panicum virgatum]|uniref:Reverse transcriptase zinc-binding domain-containing protein n=1 Tax=Panicum virgatum TaxID=38727 RepID=A0A8T0X6M2_PANVG|nr:hypothetical protein PVAP13_1KG069342 [Panicum virgatum]